MFDIGGWEFLIVIVVAIIVIGPKDLPGAIRTLTGWIRRARELARDFQSGIDDLAREADMDNVKNEIQSGLGLDDITGTGNTIRDGIERTIDPDGDIGNAFNDDYAAIDEMAVDEDGPFADNSFEEDEDIDGAGDDFAETERPADGGSGAGDTAEIIDKKSPERLEEASSQAVKKTNS
ncbi:MAG: Sec-independent protein translocase protein TatB [Proteobacteria bacterium]|nr:Sec-independent protein translocase protein TatB [Pseudomonadota bacterium]